MEEPKKSSRKKFWWMFVRAALFVAFIAGVSLWVYLSGFDVNALLQRVPKGKGLEVGLWVFGLFTFVTVAPISVRDLLRIYAALSLGLFWSTLWIWFGEAAAAAIAFLLARYLGRDFVEFLAGRKIEKMNLYLEKAGFKAVLIIRLVPMTPYRPLNFACGLTRVRFMDYFWASLIGMLPHVFLYQLVYSYLGEFFRRKGAGALVAVNIIAALITAIVVALIALWSRKKSKEVLSSKE